MFQKNVVEKIKCSVTFFFNKWDIYEKMWKNMAQPDKTQMAI